MPAGEPQDVEKVLVVDDDEDIVRLMKFMLEEEGFQVLEALCGVDGVELATSEIPDIVLLDIMMPDIGGYEVYRRIRDDPRTSHIPIIFVSAKAKWESVEKGISLGAEGYITKPFTTRFLIEEIRRVLDDASG